ncbi:MAG: hypothetical protein MUP63_04365 [Candidatus Nanohaloarchaeota archaeon QJJ-7]|nr:hypothetical protein [Candidatus Nanohaloarchaeota archaeon QJJ-7]
MPEKVLDANVFIHSTGLNMRFEEAVTVPSVKQELESEEARERYENSDIDAYRPGEENVMKVKERVEELGDELSTADIRVLALALERGSTVVSDDYGVQNVASSLDIEYEGFSQGNIDKEMEWKKICSRCGEEVEGGSCGRCGGEPERVPAES